MTTIIAAMTARIVTHTKYTLAYRLVLTRIEKNASNAIAITTITKLAPITILSLIAHRTQNTFVPVTVLPLSAKHIIDPLLYILETSLVLRHLFVVITEHRDRTIGPQNNVLHVK